MANDWMDKEERAYMLLQWASLAPLAPFDEVLAEQGFYTSVQRQRSDQALDAWDKEHPYQQSSELKAFHELERQGVLTQSDFFSPDKAARAPRWVDNDDRSKGEQSTFKSYSDELNELKQRQSQLSAGPRKIEVARSNRRAGVPEGGVAISHEKPVGAFRNRAGRHSRAARRLSQSG